MKKKGEVKNKMEVHCGLLLREYNEDFSNTYLYRYLEVQVALKDVIAYCRYVHFLYKGKIAH